MIFKKNILLTFFFLVLLTSLLPPNIYIVVVFSILVWILLPYRKWWGTDTVLMLMFSIMYTLMIVLGGQNKSNFLTISYLITPVAFYRFGQYLLSEYRTEKQRIILLACICTSYLLNLILLTFESISNVGIVNLDRTLMGASMEGPLAATLYGLLASFGLGCIGGVFIVELKGIIKLWLVTLSILALLTTVHLINRGGLAILSISIIVSLLVVIKYNFKQGLIIFIFLLLSGIVLSYFLPLDSEIIGAYEHRLDTGGLDGSVTAGRSDRWYDGLKEMLTHPLGWQSNYYAHNLWLDMARLGGWLSLIPFLFISVLHIKNMIYLFKNAKRDYSLLLISLNVALLLAASIEPVIEGSMLFFSILLLVWGMTSALCKEMKSFRILK